MNGAEAGPASVAPQSWNRQHIHTASFSLSLSRSIKKETAAAAAAAREEEGEGGEEDICIENGTLKLKQQQVNIVTYKKTRRRPISSFLFSSSLLFEL